MDKTKIEWADTTWNAVIGCQKISAGCKNCYAEVEAERRRGTAGFPNGFDLTLKEHRLADPLRWTRPRKVFVNSLSDLFWEKIPFEYVAATYGVMAAAGSHTFQVLTKRPWHAQEFFWKVEDRAREADLSVNEYLLLMAAIHLEQYEEFYHAKRVRGLAESLGSHMPWPLSNVHLGVSVEDGRVLHRVEHLRHLPAAVRFLSVEPLIGPLDGADFSGMDWVIIGGESGLKARPMEESWLEQAVVTAQSAGAAIFVKQMGSVWAKQNGAKHPKGGDPDEWPERYRIREFPADRPLAEVARG